jgi:DNA-binding MarR family transcriptional regulator
LAEGERDVLPWEPWSKWCASQPNEAEAFIRQFLSRDEERAWFGLLATHQRLVRELDRELLRVHRLPLSTIEALMQIAHAPNGESTITELSERVMLSPSHMSRIVMELERAGLAERTRNPADARSVRASATNKGRECLVDAAHTYLTTIRRLLFDRLTQRQTAELGSY